MTEHTVEIPALPTSVEEYISLRNDTATTPLGGAAMYVVALVLYAQDEALGLSCLTIAMDGSELSDGDAYKGKSPSRQRLRDQRRHLPRAGLELQVEAGGGNPLALQVGADLRDGGV